MANELYNATYLDGTSQLISSGSLHYVDDSDMGARGRNVAYANPATAGVQFELVHIKEGAVTAGQVYEIFAHIGGRDITGLNGLMRFRDPVTNDLIGQVAIPLVKPFNGYSKRGLPDTFGFIYFKGPLPYSGIVRVVANAYGPSLTSKVAMMKPFIGRAIDGVKKQCWQPGPHFNTDLNLPSWPTELPDLLADGYDPMSNPGLKQFSGDDGVESTFRVAQVRRVMLKGQMSLNMEQRDILEQFYESTKDTTFWFTRRDTQQVYIARWSAEGEPNDSGLLANQRRTTIGLNMVIP